MCGIAKAMIERLKQWVKRQSLTEWIKIFILWWMAVSLQTIASNNYSYDLQKIKGSIEYVGLKVDEIDTTLELIESAIAGLERNR